MEEDVESHLAAVEEDEDSHRWQDENEASKMADPSETVAVVHTGLPKEDEGSANEDGRYWGRLQDTAFSVTEIYASIA